MITKYTEYIKENMYSEKKFIIFIEINNDFGNIYFKEEYYCRYDNYDYNLRLFFKRLKTKFKQIGLLLRKTGSTRGELSYNINHDDFNSDIFKFLKFYYNKIDYKYTNYNQVKFDSDTVGDMLDKMNDIINIFKYKLSDEMIRNIDLYLKNEDKFDFALVPFLTKVQTEKYKHLINAKNFDLLW